MVNFLLNKAISKLKNGPFKLDESIRMMDLMGIVFRRIICAIRGAMKRPGMKACGKMLFVGKAVKLRNKHYMTLGSGVTLGDYVEVDALSINGVSIGNNFNMGSYSIIRCTGTIRKIGKGIKTGNNCGIGDYCFFGAAGGITIGDDVIMGQNVRFHSENHNFAELDIPIRLQGVSHKGIVIGNDCWIGAGCVFLDGVNVGEGCVIGSNTLVNKDIPPYSVAVGNPVRIIKNRKAMQEV